MRLLKLVVCLATFFVLNQTESAKAEPIFVYSTHGKADLDQKRLFFYKSQLIEASKTLLKHSRKLRMSASEQRDIKQSMQALKKVKDNGFYDISPESEWGDLFYQISYLTENGRGWSCCGPDFGMEPASSYKKDVRRVKSGGQDNFWVSERNSRMIWIRDERLHDSKLKQEQGARKVDFESRWMPINDGDCQTSEGHETIMVCKGPSRLDIVVSYAIRQIFVTVENQQGKSKLITPDSGVMGHEAKIEWRMANNKPVALLFHVWDHPEIDIDVAEQEKIRERLLVVGLGKLAKLRKSYPIKASATAVRKGAREAIDKAYLKLMKD